MKYTKDLLQEILDEGGAVVLEEYTKWNQRMKVRFRCSCGVDTDKRFEMLNKYHLPYCKECCKNKVLERQKTTCLEKYGVDNASRLSEVKEKIKKVYQEKYGDHPKRTEAVKNKWVETCMEKYGGHPNQNRDVQAKSEFKGCNYKEFTFPSGKKIKVQGYEHLAIIILLTQLNEEEIVIGKAFVPTINYSINNIKHVYFPDIYIPMENKIIEVKSEWSLKYPRSHIEEKALATVKEGYLYEIWVFTGNKKLTRKIIYNREGEKEIIPV
jgi:hypothetical protein